MIFGKNGIERVIVLIGFKGNQKNHIIENTKIKEERKVEVVVPIGVFDVDMF